MEMFAFLGKLFGIAARSKNYMDLSLNPLVWKLIVREPITEEDLAGVNESEIKRIRRIRKLAAARGSEAFGGGGVGGGGEGESGRASWGAGGTDEEDEEDMNLPFYVYSVGGTEVELHEGGTMHALQIGVNEQRYIDELLAYRRSEMEAAARAIRIGLETQIPSAVLTLMRGSELERIVCGSSVVDLKLLKACTEYQSCSATDPHIEFFWQVMEEDFTEEERSLFLRFVWGRSRLPLNKSEFDRLFKIQVLSSSPPDNYLPVSHTCFFSIELPRYTSRQACLEKLRFAIHNCQDFANN